MKILREPRFEEDRELWERTQKKIRKRIVDIANQDATYLKNVIQSRTEKESYNKSVEIARGCRWGCRFCIVTAFYKPYRERPLDVIKEVIDHRLNMGIDKISVGAPTPPDYSQICSLGHYLLSKGIRFDIQSERMDTFDEEMARAHVLSGRRHISMAIEAPDPLTRKQINKNLPREIITRAVTNGLKAGFKQIKFMFMLCHPFETPENASKFEGLMNHVFELREKYNPRTSYLLNVCPFIPKPWTTFQWAPLREDTDLFNAANKAIESARRTPIGAHRFAMNFIGGPVSRWMDTFFSRGDRRVSDVLIAVHTKGKPRSQMLYEFPYGSPSMKCVQTIKGFCMAYNIPWRRYIEGVSGEGYQLDDDLPWDFINIGVTKQWLKEDWERAKQGIENVSCKDGCAKCGACPGYKDMNLKFPPTYKNEPFTLNVSMKEFMKARHTDRYKHPRRRFTLYYIKNPKVTRVNIQNFRREVTRVLQLAGLVAETRSVYCMSNFFYNGMSWSGVDVVDLQAYVPTEIDAQKLSTLLAPIWKENFGELTLVRETDHSFKRDLDGIEVELDLYIPQEQVDDFIEIVDTFKFLRADRTSEKKTNQGESEYINLKDYFYSMGLVNGKVRIEMPLKGNAYEFIQALLGIDRKLAERHTVTIVSPIWKEGWELKK